MGRKNKRNKNKRSNRSGGYTRDIITVSSRQFTIVGLAGGVGQISLSPSSFIEAAAISDVFELYRVTKLRYRLHRHVSTSGSLAAVYIAGVVDNAPSTAADASVSPYTAVITPTATVPSGWRTVSRRDLVGYQPWYKTIAGSPDPAQEVQGRIYLAGLASDFWTVEVEVVYQFKSPCTSSATPAERGARECALERERLLRILAAAPTLKL